MPYLGMKVKAATWTGVSTAGEIRRRAEIGGDAALAEPLLGVLAVMGSRAVAWTARPPSASVLRA